MHNMEIETINYAELASRLADSRPDNSDRSRGYALVNVLKPEAFKNEHIPASINIPKGDEQTFEDRFSKDKEIIVYCASPTCDASVTVAKRLAEMGFEDVYDYEAGLSDWKQSGGAIESGPAG